MNLQPIDLRTDVHPISKVASSLAALIKQARTTGRPVIVTQKGYPSGVLLSVELFNELREAAEAAHQAEAEGAHDDA